MQAKTGFESDLHVAAPPYFLLDNENKGSWPIKEALASGSSLEVTSLEAKFGALPGIFICIKYHEKNLKLKKVDNGKNLLQQL
jgi:hypothetical protein